MTPDEYSLLYAVRACHPIGDVSGELCCLVDGVYRRLSPEALDSCEEKGWIENDGTHLALTASGQYNMNKHEKAYWKIHRKSLGFLTFQKAVQ